MPLDFLFTIYSSYKIKHRAKNGGSVKMVLYIFGFWRWKVKRITIFNIVFVQSAKRVALKAAWNALSQKSYGLLTCKCQWGHEKFRRNFPCQAVAKNSGNWRRRKWIPPAFLVGGESYWKKRRCSTVFDKQLNSKLYLLTTARLPLSYLPPPGEFISTGEHGIGFYLSLTRKVS